MPWQGWLSTTESLLYEKTITDSVEYVLDVLFSVHEGVGLVNQIIVQKYIDDDPPKKLLKVCDHLLESIELAGDQIPVKIFNRSKQMLHLMKQLYFLQRKDVRRISEHQKICYRLYILDLQELVKR